ncbi:MAG TPA: hypothetical protein DEQ38_11965 [Elusimicrobia bacterium]|nr:MAG: hypothetical protein A2089_05405 [Elusimicrobia bacterium GWD2_63_28]HCC48813.1 hypothetical protein [Elusimicrobiota bacterium]
MKRRYLCAASAALALLAAAAGMVSAASPGRLSYQGTLRKDGRLFSGTVAMEFQITGADGTADYWHSNSTDVAVSTGLFRYPLGTPNEAAFAAIAWKDITPYVKMKLDGAWLPPEPLYASAYALHSGTAEASTGTFTVNGGDLLLSGSAGTHGIIFPDGSAQYRAPGWTVSANGLYTSFSGGAGVGLLTPETRLDVQAAGGDPYIQFWRDSSGVIRSSLTAAGLLYADGSRLRNLPAGADSLGSHIATATLQMGGFPVTGAGAITSSGQFTTYSSATVASAAGLGAAGLDLAPEVRLSSSAPAFNGGVYISSNIYAVGIASAARYYGDGSPLAGVITSTAAIIASISGNDALAAHLAGAETFTGAKTFGNAALTLTGPNGNIVSGSSITTSGGFFGNGSALSGVITSTAAIVASLGGKADDTLAAHLAGAETITGAKTFSDVALTLTGANGNIVSGSSITTSGGFFGDGSGLAGVITSTAAIVTSLNGKAEDTLAAHLAGAETFTGAKIIDNVAFTLTGPNGNIVSNSSITTTGGFFGDGSGLTGLPAGNVVDTLADTLAVSGDAGNRYINNLSSAAIGRAEGAAALDLQAAALDEQAQLWRASDGTIVASMSAAGYFQAAKFIGDGSGLAALDAAGISVGTLADERLSANVGLLASSQVFSGANIFTSTAAFTAADPVLPGLYVSSGLVVAAGGVGIGVSAPQQKLEVLGGIKLADTLIDSPGTLKYDGAFQGYNGTAWVTLNGSYSLDTSTALWGINEAVTPNTVYTVGASSNVAIGTMNAGASKLRVTGNGSGSGTNAFLAESLAGTLFTIRDDGNVGVGPLDPATRLDLQAAGGDAHAQIWRDSGGTVVASMSAAGYFQAAAFIGDGSQLSGLPSGNTIDTLAATLGAGSDAGGTGIVNAGAVAIGVINAGDNKLLVRGIGNTSATNALRAEDIGSLPLLVVQNGGNIGLGVDSPATRLELKAVADDAHSQIWRNSGDVVVASMSAAGYLQAVKFIGDGSELSGISGGNVVDTLADTLALSGDAGNRYINNLSSAAIGRAAGEAALDLQAAALDEQAQLWRASGGTIVASMSAAGYLQAVKFIGDGSQLSGISGGGAGDSLGVHIATQTLNLAGNAIVGVSSITVSTISSEGDSVFFSASVAVDGGLAASGDLTAGSGVQTSTISASGFISLANLASAPAGAGYGAIYYNPAAFDNQGALYLNLNGAFVPIATGTVAGGAGMTGVISDADQFSGDGAGVPTTLTLKASSVTLQGNAFNGAGQLVLLGTDGKLPAVDGSLLTGISGGGAGDSLGVHIATQTLNLAGNWLLNASTITVLPGEPGIAFSTSLYVGGNVLATGGALFGAGPVVIGNTMPLASLHISSVAGYAGDLVAVSTGMSLPVIRMTGAGEIYANYFYGDGSGLTGVSAGGFPSPVNEDLNMNGKSVYGANEVEVSSRLSVGNSASIASPVAALVMEMFADADISEDPMYPNEGLGVMALLDLAAPRAGAQKIIGGDFMAGTGMDGGNTNNFPFAAGLRAGALAQSGGTIGAAYGLFAQNNHSAGSVTRNYGVYVQNKQSAGTANQYNYGLFLDVPDSSGTITENYGLYIKDQSTFGLMAHNIWSAGPASINYFEGTVQAENVWATNAQVTSKFILPSKTLAALQALVPASKGETYFCETCVPPKIVVSTGTAAGNFADAVGGTFE